MINFYEIQPGDLVRVLVKIEDDIEDELYAKVKENNELEVELAEGVKVRVVQSTIAQVLSKTEPATDA
jgi:preprotein translocase subunit YajC